MSQCESLGRTLYRQNQGQNLSSESASPPLRELPLKALSRVRIAFAKRRQVALLSAKTTEVDRLDNPSYCDRSRVKVGRF
jgi:hypothetical protein